MNNKLILDGGEFGMTNNEKWNVIVGDYSTHANSAEKEIQSAWELFCQELFEFKTVLREIVAQPQLRVGSNGAAIAYKQPLSNIIFPRVFPPCIFRESGVSCRLLQKPFSERPMKTLLRFVKQNTVLCVAFVAALVTSFFVPPDAEWAGYFDWKTLACLFMTLGVVCALRDIKFFSIVARRMVRLTGNLRMLTLALVYITFLGSMLIANDMALITFLPLGYFALDVTKQQKHMAYVFILQNISANLGGMLTPFGNPQNLYLYTAFSIPTGEFMGIMLPPFLLAVAMLTVCCLLLKPTPLRITEVFPEKLNVRRTALYFALFALSILIVFRLVPYYVGLVLVPAVLLIADRNALAQVDYPLLGTFFLFFIFSGNLSRIPEVRVFLSGLLDWDALLVPVLSCQLISNVPTAILLSRFTENYRALLLGVNIGGTGTLIASLASLISFSEFRLLCPGEGKRYFRLFTLVNLVFLVVMTAAAKLWFV